MVQHGRKDELSGFFEHTYVRGRRLRERGQAQSCNVCSRVMGSTQISVKWYRSKNKHSRRMADGLQSLFHCHHPTVVMFLIGEMQDMMKQATGVLHPPNKEYSRLQARELNAVW